MFGWRCGVLVPWMNRTVEDELPQLLLNVGVGLHWARLRPNPLPSGPDDETYLARMMGEVPDALASLAPTDLDLLVLACTSAALGPMAVRTRVPMVTAFDCVLEVLGDGPVMLCAPYSWSLIEQMAEALEVAGHPVLVKARVNPKGEFRDVTAAEIAQTIAAAWTPSVEKIVLSCTALYTLGLTARLKLDHGIQTPIISSIEAIAEVIRARSRSKNEGAVAGIDRAK